MGKEKFSSSFVVLLGVLFVLPSMGWAACTVIDSPTASCTGDGSTISSLMSCVKSGDTLSVTGSCSDNVIITKGGITLNGPGVTITAADPTMPVVEVIGSNTTINGFTISGGTVGVLAAEEAHINLLNNTIINTTKAGVIVRENSSAHIGFHNFSDTTASPNTIGPNTGLGIDVDSTSSAKIIGNTITGNTGDGILVRMGSQAEIAGNVIDSNSVNGVEVRGDSGVNLADNTIGGIYAQLNSTNGNAQNQGVGVACLYGGVVAGNLGLLDGVKGTNYFDSTCVNALAVSPYSLVGTWNMTSCTESGGAAFCPTGTLQLLVSPKGSGVDKEGTKAKPFTWILQGLDLTIIGKNNTMFGPITWTDNKDFSWTFEEAGQAGSATMTFKHK